VYRLVTLRVTLRKLFWRVLMWISISKTLIVTELCKSNKRQKRSFPVTNNVPQFPYADRPAEGGLMLFFTFVRVVINYKHSRPKSKAFGQRLVQTADSGGNCLNYDF